MRIWRSDCDLTVEEESAKKLKRGKTGVLLKMYSWLQGEAESSRGWRWSCLLRGLDASLTGKNTRRKKWSGGTTPYAQRSIRHAHCSIAAGVGMEIFWDVSEVGFGFGVSSNRR